MVVQGQQRNVRKSVQHVQNLLFCLGRVQAAPTGIRIFLKRHISRIIYLRRHRPWKSPHLFFLSFLPFLSCFILFCLSKSNISSEFCTVPKRIPKWTTNDPEGKIRMVGLNWIIVSCLLSQRKVLKRLIKWNKYGFTSSLFFLKNVTLW